MWERKWTREEEQFLIENYEYMKTDELMRNLNGKTNDQIRWKAKNYKLHKRVTKSKKDISWLENLNIPENCYWWGFITADGCITSKQLILSISVNDKQHLERFSELSNCKIVDVYRENGWNVNGYTMSRIAINDFYTIGRIIERFSILPKKTYNPFNIDEFLTHDRLKYFITGLIDGDGHIDKTSKNIRIKIHPNWTDNLKKISDNLKIFYDINSKIRLTKEGWVVLSIPVKDSKVLKKLIVVNPIPYMVRKWDRIDAV